MTDNFHIFKAFPHWWSYSLHFGMDQHSSTATRRFLVPKISTSSCLWAKSPCSFRNEMTAPLIFKVWHQRSFIATNRWAHSAPPTQQLPRWQLLPTSKPKLSSPDAAPPSVEWDGTTPSNCSRANAHRPFCAM